MNRNISIPDGHADTEIFHPRWSELKLIIMKSIELKYPVIVRERQGKFDHPKIFRPPGVSTPGGRGFAAFLNSALGFSPTLFLQLPRSCIPCMKFTSPKLYIRPLNN
ncbi:MAG: hypothetical protein OMM_07036 [Candidatus Magnetoglobus multicellularis str. Araruama]|uniref:Uncharacterized protein n=1 Tax=Candidatus Magnetoglobus multicellularis str. Araruama TaxID=890399 RepID=A0A1V1PEH9_9BACT|nr:MAG: hypothetical protein OMM_07036 [Candidatus Magnetoglobus multicellularis str. Araruama]